jgi:hypothetical protein
MSTSRMREIKTNRKLSKTVLARLIKGGSAVVVWGALSSYDVASDQFFPSPKEFELSQIRRELDRVIVADPAEASNARKALEDIDQPESTPVGRQSRNRRERGDRRIVNGIPTISYFAVGALLKGHDRRTAKMLCTGTLVGCDRYLTAAHCIENNPAPDAYLVFFPQAGFFEVKEIQWRHKGYLDLAILALATPVDGILPMTINDNDTPIPSGFPGTIVGFGRTGGSRVDSGIKREGSVKTTACPASYAGAVFCWTFHADVRPSDAASNSCFADSGGGVFMLDRDDRGKVVPKVFGVISGGRDRSCTENDLSYNVDLGKFRDWIKAAGGGRVSAQMCGDHPIPITESESRQQLLGLGTTRQEAIIHLPVPANIQSLRVAMNAEDSVKNDFDLALYRGESVASGTPLCNENGSGQFAFCNIERPPNGSWTIAITRKNGEGEAQITATLIQTDSRQ